MEAGYTEADRPTNQRELVRVTETTAPPRFPYIDVAQLRIRRPEAVSDQPIGRCRISFLAESLWVEESSGELEKKMARATERRLDGSKHTYVFTDTVRSCKRVFELVLASLSELTATPSATPLAKWSSALVFP